MVARSGQSYHHVRLSDLNHPDLISFGQFEGVHECVPVGLPSGLLLRAEPVVLGVHTLNHAETCLRRVFLVYRHFLELPFTLPDVRVQRLVLGVICQASLHFDDGEGRSRIQETISTLISVLLRHFETEFGRSLEVVKPCGVDAWWILCNGS